MRFTKMHGLGNDFLITEEHEADLAAAARKLCPRRTSVGADGIIAVCPSETADVRMRIFNSDGSEAEMCGNGIRCFARYVRDHGIVDGNVMDVETDAGIMRPEILEDGRVEVNMGRPEFAADQIPVRADDPQSFSIPLGDGTVLEGAAVLMGVPHVVLFRDASEGPLDEADIAAIGPAVEAHPMFPRKTNVNFAEITAPDTLRVRTWERGAGRTMACGTGSCSAALLAHRKGLTGDRVTVRLDAGELEIRIEPDGTVYMTGPAEYVYDGATREETLP